MFHSIFFCDSSPPFSGTPYRVHSFKSLPLYGGLKVLHTLGKGPLPRPRREGRYVQRQLLPSRVLASLELCCGLAFWPGGGFVRSVTPHFSVGRATAVDDRGATTEAQPCCLTSSVRARSPWVTSSVASGSECLLVVLADLER